MGYYKSLLLKSYDSCGKDAQEGIKSDPLITAKSIELAEKNCLPSNISISDELKKKLEEIQKIGFFGRD